MAEEVDNMEAGREDLTEAVPALALGSAAVLKELKFLDQAGVVEYKGFSYRVSVVFTDKDGAEADKKIPLDQLSSAQVDFVGDTSSFGGYYDFDSSTWLNKDQKGTLAMDDALLNTSLPLGILFNKVCKLEESGEDSVEILCDGIAYTVHLSVTGDEGERIIHGTFFNGGDSFRCTCEEINVLSENPYMPIMEPDSGNVNLESLLASLSRL